MQNKFIEEQIDYYNKSGRNFAITNSQNNKISKSTTSPPWFKHKVLRTNRELNTNCKLLYQVLFNKKRQIIQSQILEKKSNNQNDDYLQLIIRKMQSRLGPKQIQQKRPHFYNLNVQQQKEFFEERKKIWQKYSPCQSHNKNFTYYVGMGNNPDLIKRIMKSRLDWNQYEPGVSKSINFKWQQTNYNYNYSQIQKRNLSQIVNHFEHHEEISTKSKLIKNLQIYCQTNKIQIFTITPITFVINLESQYAEYQLKQFFKCFIRKNLPKNDKQYQIVYEYLKKIKPILKDGSNIRKKINILSQPVMFSSYYNGNNLWLLKPTALNRGRGIELFNTIQQLQNLFFEYKQLSNLEKRKKIMMMKKSLDKILLPKQTLNSNQRTHQKFQKVKQNQKSQKKKNQFKIKKVSKNHRSINPNDLEHNKPLTSNDFYPTKKHSVLSIDTLQFVLQKYIEKPLLIEGRKFDIRIWILVDIKLQIYIFKEGYVRTSSQLFNLDDISNYYIHLTNNAVQKNNQNYGQYEKGNQISFKELQEIISKNIENFSMVQIFKKIKQISYIAMSSVKKKLDPHQRDISFQLFGLDFLIDENLKVWLIQVNTNPCIEQSSPLLQKLLPRLINDMFKLTIDEYFKNNSMESHKSKQLSKQTQNYHVEGYKDNENMFESLGKLIPNNNYKKQVQFHLQQL